MAHYLTQEEREERVRQLTGKLESGISEVFQSDRYADYLRTMSKFHQYSFRNTILIFLQFPNASQVAGYNDWKKKFGRHVKAHESGISILAPCASSKQVQMVDPETQLPVFDANGQPVMERAEVTRYRVVTVFDVSQTEGKELPEPCVTELTGDVPGFERMTAALQALSPLPVFFEDFPKDAYGYCDHVEGRIVVRPGLSQKQTLKTLVHEITHQEQFQYLMKNRIETAEQLTMQYDAIQAEIDALTGQRRELYKLRRSGQGGGAVSDEIAAITAKLRPLRRELKLCARIEGDIPTVRSGVEDSEKGRSKAHEKTDKSRPDRHRGAFAGLLDPGQR